jgi:hypothetical protein
MSGYAYGEHEPTEACPYCSTICRADFVDIGVGFTQCGPFHCEQCGASEIGPYDQERELIDEELNQLSNRLDQLKDLASEPTWVTQAISYRGLTTNERNELQKMADYLMEIQRTVENGRRISRLFGRTGENWDALLADCAVAKDVAQQTYDRRY